ncbi:hypothetical protein OG21DRAFT_1514107 [Imleria badia]|nr:hypothetical protein OG21DRAFT_1514107 [Imleria badia]
MGTVLIKNNTRGIIHVRITATSEPGHEGFFDISSGETAPWNRKNWEVAFILRDDNSKTETLVVQPDAAYTIE